LLAASQGDDFALLAKPVMESNSAVEQVGFILEADDPSLDFFVENDGV